MTIFNKLQALFEKREVSEPPSFWMIHRFLASDRDFARVAREINLTYLDDERLWAFWYGLIPERSISKKWLARNFTYVAPTQPDEPSELVQRLMEVRPLSRSEAEEIEEFAEMQGKKRELKQNLGVPNG